MPWTVTLSQGDPEGTYGPAHGWAVAVSADDASAGAALLTATLTKLEAGDDAATASTSDATGSCSCTFDGSPAPDRAVRAVQSYLEG